MQYKFARMLLIAAVGFGAAPAIAQNDAPSGEVAAAAPTASAAPIEIKRNKTLVDASGRPIGEVFEVFPDKGYITVQREVNLYRVPTNTISLSGKRYMTSLTREQIVQ